MTANSVPAAKDDAQRVPAAPTDRSRAAVVTAPEVRAQLERMFATPNFQLSARNRQFLRYIIEEALAGRQDRLKAYTVATEVFGRSSSFDPQKDPIVRVEAGHIRQALTGYYAGAGGADPVVIDLPKGAYVPAFHLGSGERPWPWRRWLRPALLAAVVLSVAALLVWADAAGLRRSLSTSAPPTVGDPAVVVGQFHDMGHDDRTAQTASYLHDEIVNMLARFPEMRIVASEGADLTHSLPSDYLLSGSVFSTGASVRIMARLVEPANGTVLWSQSYDVAPDAVVSDRLTGIATEIATAIGQPNGAIQRAEIARGGVAIDQLAYACMLRFFDRRITLDPADLPQTRLCLEDSVARYPDNATIWALLAITQVDEARFGAADPAASPSYADALESANRAVALDPDNSRALEALMLAAFFAGKPDLALDAGQRAVQRNPSDKGTLAEYGMRLAFAGDWVAGCNLLRSGQDQFPGGSGHASASLALCAYMMQDFTAANALIRTSTTPDNLVRHFLAAAIYGQVGDIAAAKVERQWLEAHATDQLAHLDAELHRRFSNERDRQLFLDGLRKAGIDE